MALWKSGSDRVSISYPQNQNVNGKEDEDEPCFSLRNGDECAGAANGTGRSSAPDVRAERAAQDARRRVSQRNLPRERMVQRGAMGCRETVARSGNRRAGVSDAAKDLEDGSPAFATEIVAEEFLFVHPARANASAQASPAVTAAVSNKKHDSGFTTAAPTSMMSESAAVEIIAAEPAPMQAG